MDIIERLKELQEKGRPESNILLDAIAEIERLRSVAGPVTFDDAASIYRPLRFAAPKDEARPFVAGSVDAKVWD